MEEKMDKDLLDTPLSQSNVTLRLADIQKRCSQLLDNNDELNALSLEEESVAVADDSNPYNRG